jgi:hypothetical protein
MAYLTTFNAVFFFLVTLTVVSVTVGLIAGTIAKKRDKFDQFAEFIFKHRLKVNLAWVAVLVLDGFLSPKGLCSFLVWSVVAGIASSVVIMIVQTWQAKRMIRESIRQSKAMLGLGS